MDEAPFIIDKNVPTFNLSTIAKGDIVRAKYHTWDEPRNGIVVLTGDSVIQIAFFPKVNRIMRHYLIAAAEVRDNKWHILYTKDLINIKEVGSNGIDNGSTDSSAADSK